MHSSHATPAARVCACSATPAPTCASTLLTHVQNLFKKFSGNQEPPKAFFDALGQNRDYNVDLIPKFIMANGEGR